MTQRELDTEALEEYRTIVQEQLKHIEDIIPRLEKGEKLGRMPAFGQLDSAATARQNYEAFHQTTWDNLQDLREALHGMIRTLNDSAELSEESEQITAGEMDGYGTELES